MYVQIVIKLLKKLNLSYSNREWIRNHVVRYYHIHHTSISILQEHLNKLKCYCHSMLENLMNLVWPELQVHKTKPQWNRSYTYHLHLVWERSVRCSLAGKADSWSHQQCLHTGGHKHASWYKHCERVPSNIIQVLLWNISLCGLLPYHW